MFNNSLYQAKFLQLHVINTWICKQQERYYNCRLWSLENLKHTTAAATSGMHRSMHKLVPAWYANRLESVWGKAQFLSLLFRPSLETLINWHPKAKRWPVHTAVQRKKSSLLFLLISPCYCSISASSLSLIIFLFFPLTLFLVFMVLFLYPSWIFFFPTVPVLAYFTYFFFLNM